MRAYSAASEEAVHARDLVKDWAGEGFLTAEQYRLMEQETVSDLRRTNIFLRLVLFFFTLIIVAAAVGLFYSLFLDRSTSRTIAIFLLIFAAGSYAVAELAVSRYRLYRYGIEEALAAFSVALLCTGIEGVSSSGENLVVSAAGAITWVWIWHRFGLPYAPLAAMLFVPWLAGELTSSRPAQHVLTAAFYAAGLSMVATIRRPHRLTYLKTQYSIAEALLWLGIYLAINLQLSSVDLLGTWWSGSANTAAFPRQFYWTTWVLTWCLPPVVLARGLRQKDRFVLAVGGVTAILTLTTNKPYLGWPRHTWDPMLLGALLIGVALFLRRWLAQGPTEVRRGFTARCLSGKDKTWLNAGTTAVGLAAPNIIQPSPQTGTDVHFDGGRSGGGGASSDF